MLNIIFFFFSSIFSIERIGFGIIIFFILLRKSSSSFGTYIKILLLSSSEDVFFIIIFRYSYSLDESSEELYSSSSLISEE